jgi:ABC-type multidrug transport system ATPase subunit
VVRLAARGVVFDYPGPRRALAGVDLDLAPGELVALLGPNGSGKSTLLRMLFGLVRPHGGTARVDGAPLSGDGVAIRRRAAYLCGEIHAYGELTGRAHLDWCLRGRERAARPRARELAERFELPLEKRVRGYSHGMKRQLFLAAALAPAVRVRILDEPTEGLDPTRRGQVLELLRAEAEHGVTILLSSHHLGEVERACSRQLFLRRGELLDEESARELHARARQALRIQWSSAPDPRAVARALDGLGAIEVRLDETRGTFFFPGVDGAVGRSALRALLASGELPEPRSLSYGELSLAELYRELYGVEGV